MLVEQLVMSHLNYALPVWGACFVIYIVSIIKLLGNLRVCEPMWYRCDSDQMQ